MKKIVSIISLIAIFLTALAAPVFADGPQFNSLPGDLKLLNVANRTTNTGWQNNSVSASANDSVAFQVYYHNGIVGTTANNTRIRLNFPTNAENSINVSATLTADNANTVTDSVVIYSSPAQRLVVDTSSIRWYPNRTETAQYISASSSGNGYAEVNIGAIQGCWEYQGYVTFVASLIPESTPTYNLAINKTVRNITNGSGSYADSVNAKNNDRVGFQIQIQNTGNATLNNVVVRDVLPSGLTYSSGTARLDGGTLSDGLISGGINIGSLSAGASKYILFEATVNNYQGAFAYYNYQNQINYAYVKADNANEINDTATVYISQTNASNLTIVKTVRNITTGTSLQESVNANANDRVMFSIQVSAPSYNASANNVRVWDTLPSGLSYVSGSTRLDSGYIGDGIISGGINLGSLYSGQTKTINFEATVNSTGYIGQQTLTNYAYASADNTGQVSDFAQVIAGTTPAPTPSNLMKRVANLTWSNGSDTDNQAHVGDILQYTLSYTNNTNSTLYNVQILDVLPSYTAFNDSISGNGFYSNAGNMITWNVGTLSQGQTVSMTYRATVQAVPNDNYVIINSALLRASGINDVVSNETRTTVVGVIKGAVIKAVTGGNDLFRTSALALIIALWGIFIAYLVMEYPELWRGLGLKLKTLKIRALNR